MFTQVSALPLPCNSYTDALFADRFRQPRQRHLRLQGSLRELPRMQARPTIMH